MTLLPLWEPETKRKIATPEHADYGRLAKEA
jgi:hypothetical protein